MSEAKEVSVDLTKGPIGRQILQFTVPLLLGNIFQQFYNAADTVFVGKFVGRGALAEQAEQWRTYADGVRGVLEGGVFCGA